MYLALIETSANQQFIFSTNKLSENIGASELTYIAGSKWVVEAVNNVNGFPDIDPKTFEYSDSFREWLLNDQKNHSINDDPKVKVKVEIIIATSGKALFLARKKEDARSVIRQVTQRALVEAPGLDICGVISEFDIEKDSLSTINKQIHQKFESVRAKRPGSESRFLRLPIVAECATSGMPASKAIRDAGDKIIPISEVSKAKRAARNPGFHRIQKLLNRRNLAWSFIADDSDFEQESSWKAIIHADGNGLGQIFLDFGKTLSNSDYIQQYRQFSCAIDICTEEAFLDAIETIFADRLNSIPIPMRPLILGGDDLTVICDGKFALKFTEQFLRNFEQRTSQEINNEFIEPDIILQHAEQHLPAKRLSACAGVAIVKNHFPFSVAYHLAEDLIKSAKTVKEIVKTKEGKTIPCSAIDYHMLYDTSSVDLETIRQKLQIDHSSTQLFNRPYIVSTLDWYTDHPKYDWIKRHHWQALSKKVEVVNAKDNEDRSVLPNSQIHDLREGLFLGQKLADTRYHRIRHRYENIGELEGDKDSLFWLEPTDPNNDESLPIHTTALIDVMDAANFWGKE
jgi:hypothetical protein